MAWSLPLYTSLKPSPPPLPSNRCARFLSKDAGRSSGIGIVPSLCSAARCRAQTKNSDGGGAASACILSSLLLPFAPVGTPLALAVTGENGGDDLITTLISGGAIAFVYLFVVPPILMNWMRVRWYRREFLEMYLQFMLVFIFFPGLLLWAPFLNFRKLPRDPTMEYPWSTPKDDVPLFKSR